MDANENSEPPPRPDGTEEEPTNERNSAISPSPDLTVSQDAEEIQQAQERSEELVGLGPEAPGYRLLKRLGLGTYGMVFLAEEQSTGIRVAIKFLSHSTGREWQLLQEEVTRLALLHADPGIVQLKDANTEARPPYYVMRYAEGGSLAGRLEQGPLPLAEALVIFTQVAQALAYVHSKGIRHCDLKPGNVLLDARGRALLADFGQAQLSSDTAPALGTFFYMAPEQADLAPQIPDTRWDVYGLGALLYAMLTGRPPRDDSTLRAELKSTPEISQRLRRYRESFQRSPRPGGHRRVGGIDRRLVEIIDRCLEVDPEQRLRDAGAVLEALQRRERQRRQRPLLIFGLVGPLLLLLFMAYAAMVGGRRAIARSQNDLTEQLLQSDMVSARLVANAIQERLEDQVRLLESRVDWDLYFWTKTRRRRYLDELLVKLLSRARRTHWKFTEATVSNHEGEILALVREGQDGFICVPEDQRLSKFKQFSWRDWFSGKGDRFDAMTIPHPPIRQPHISDPYVSSLDRSMFISISIPIRPPGEPRAEPLGVLEAAVKLSDVNQWLQDVKITHGFAVLLNQRRYCLLHCNDKITPDYLRPPPRFDFAHLDRVMRARQKETGSRDGKISDYRDPVDRQTYLAGYAQMKPGIGWVVLVQHERSAAMRPVEELKGELRSIHGRVLAITVLLLCFLWGWLFQLMRRL